ncbi:hypothetical protein V3N99_07955 [Dermatophilaceae bacterium Soc4.6]
MTNDGGLIRVGAEQLDGMADHIRTIHGSMSSGFEALSTDLLNTMADWGEGTASREAYDGFKGRVDRTFADMLVAVNAMPPLVAQAAEEARSGEVRRAGMWGG